jgi:regulator of protease activity HflC (stomatin/prohibitin superfamily)
MRPDRNDTDKSIKILTIFFISIVLFFPIYMSFIHPMICIWQERQAGLAELARAESNRQIKVCEAVAFKESAKSLAEAEIIRARGVAKANEIIGQSLSGNEQYLRYLWIQSLKDNGKEVIYIPTEANLPILEANRLKGEK